MTIAIAWRAVAWRLLPTGAARGRTRREAILLEVRTASGAIGLGEAAPLPGLSIDTLADVIRAIERLAVPDRFEEMLDSVATVGSPAARFAIETALLDALAHEQSTTIACLLLAGSRVSADVHVATVIDDVAGARAAVAAGARCLKIKLGAGGDLDRVRAIAEAVPGVRLRLDANRSWPAHAVRERLAMLAGLPIDFIEEPCIDAHRLLVEPLPCPLALDESLVTLSPAELDAALRSPSLAALVLKPTLLGGLRACLALARRAREAGKHAIVSHALEGSIGMAACMQLAHAVGGDVPAGLGPHPGLAAWGATLPSDLRSACAMVDDPLTAAADVPAIVTAADTISFADAAHRAGDRGPSQTPRDLPSQNRHDDDRRRSAGQTRIIVATAGVETIGAIYCALDAQEPIALLHPAADLARQRAQIEAAQVPPDAAVVLFTSGSTGEPRGVVLSRSALIAAADASEAHLGWCDDDRWLLALSLAHAGGLAVVVRCLLARKPLVLLERDSGRSTASLLEGCTLASLVPAQLAALLDDPQWRPSARLRAVLVGGAAASRALLEAAAARGVPVLTTYGMTESFGQLATAPLARAGDPDAPLVALAGVELAGGTRACPAAIRVRAPMLATCYLDGTPIAPELVTRDLGFVEDGALHVVGRADDVIVTGGENVHPSTIEAVLAATPGVRAACAFAVPDERWGQIVGAAIALDDAGVIDPSTLHSWHTQLPPHARPRELAVVRELPTLTNGKLDRRAASQLPREPVRYR